MRLIYKILSLAFVSLLFFACTNSINENNINGDWFYIGKDGTYNEVYIDSISFNFSNENIGRDFYRRMYKRNDDTIIFFDSKKNNEKAIIDNLDNNSFKLIFIQDGDIIQFEKLKENKVASEILEEKITQKEYFWAMEQRSKKYSDN